MVDDEQHHGYEQIMEFSPAWTGLEEGIVDHGAWMGLTGGSAYSSFRMWRTGPASAGVPYRPAMTALRARAINIVLRVAAAQSGAVEDLYSLEPGVTMSIGEDRPGWRSDVRNSQEAAGDSGASQIDALIETYEHIQREAPLLDPLPDHEAGATDEPLAEPLYVSEAWIRSLHASATKNQLTYKVITPVGPQMHPMVHGEYKDEPNHVIRRDGTTHYYCEPLDVGFEMSRLAEQLNSSSFRYAHPILQAAYAHWAITHIHPFADGNGRVARAVASLYLLNWHRIPVLIFADRKLPYFKALEEADHHRPQALIQYLQGRALDTGAWISELEHDISNPPLSADVSKLGMLLKSLQGASLENRDSAAVRVRDRLVVLFQEAQRGQLADILGELLLMDLNYSLSVGYVNYRDIFRDNIDGPVRSAVPNSTNLGSSGPLGGFALKIRIKEPVLVERTVTLETFVSTLSGDRLPVAVVARCGPMMVDIRLLLEDCSPTLSEATELRLQSLTRRILAACIQQLQSEIESLLDSHGQSGASSDAD